MSNIDESTNPNVIADGK